MKSLLEKGTSLLKLSLIALGNKGFNLQKGIHLPMPYPIIGGILVLGLNVLEHN